MDIETTGPRALRQLTRDWEKGRLAATRQAVRPKVRAATEPIVRASQARSTWSRRIPPATRMVMRLNTQRASFAVEVDKRRAPHGRPFEGVTGRPNWRHPTHGHRDRWVRQAVRPFLVPAAIAHYPAATAAINSVVDDVVDAAGFRQF